MKKLFKFGMVMLLAISLVGCGGDNDSKDKKDDLLSGNHGICEILGVLAVIGLHLWKRNTLLSIFGGTIVYMLCVHVLFI